MDYNNPIIGDTDPSPVRTPTHKIWITVAGYLKIGICTTSVMASIFILYITLKYKQLIKDSLTYIVHYTLFNIIYLFFLPLYTVIYRNVIDEEMRFIPSFIAYELSISTEACMGLFGSTMTLDWYLLITENKVIEVYGKFQRMAVCFLYSLYVFAIITIIIQTSLEDTHSLGYIVSIFNIISIFTTILLNLLVLCKLNKEQQKEKYLITIATIIMFSTIFSLARFIAEIFWRPPHLSWEIIMDFAEFYSFSVMMIIVIVLGYCNTDYRLIYKSIWNCRMINHEHDNFSDNVNGQFKGLETDNLDITKV